MCLAPTDPRTRTPIVFHGCQMPRMLHNHDRLFARTNSRYLPRLLDCALPAYGGQGSANSGLLLQAEVIGRLRWDALKAG